MKTSPLYLGIDFGTTNSSVAYIYADPRHLGARYVPVEPVRITMDAENNLMAERMPSLVSTRFDDRRATGLAGGWEVLRIFGRRKKAPLLRRGHELFESVIGIMTLGNRPVCLVESGTPLPFPGEGVHAHPSDFFVPQNGQKELIIPFYAGSTEGNPRLSGSVKVLLPEGFPFPRTFHLLLPAQQRLLGPQA